MAPTSSHARLSSNNPPIRVLFSLDRTRRQAQHFGGVHAASRSHLRLLPDGRQHATSSRKHQSLEPVIPPRRSGKRAASRCTISPRVRVVEVATAELLSRANSMNFDRNAGLSQ